MAQIVWREKAEQLFWAFVEYAGQEFGKTTAQRWQKERKAIERRLERHPESYPPEELLRPKDVIFRHCHLMKRRFKIIYFYDHVENTVHIMDIWDTKRSPSALIRRIK